VTLDHDNWVSKPGIGYDESRYDPEDHRQDGCLECGTELVGAGDRAGAYSRCPECDVTVMMV
jgi:hypothetical protein